MLEMFSPLPRRFRRELRRGQFEVRPGAPETTIRQFESTYGVVVPYDMRRFYRSIDGMAPSEWAFDSDMRVLPIGEVKPVHEEFADADDPSSSQPAEAFVIADNSISAYFFAIDLRASDQPVYLVHSEPIRVATGFSDFVRKVLSDSRELFHGEHAV
jgi:hypothetical protein